MDNNIERNCCDNCIADILKVILILQQSVCPGDACLETCDRGFLGQPITGTIFNTRPFSLYLKGNTDTPLSIPISRDPTETTTSTIFRIEKLDECCATCRVLVYNAETTSYTATNSFFTVNVNCVCVIRCLDDTYVDVTL